MSIVLGQEEQRPIVKPAWLPRDQWNILYHTSEYRPFGEWVCAGCGCKLHRDICHFDHIVPRSKGGLDLASNVQPMCSDCNLRKYNFPDGYWSQSTYFDGTIHKHNLRVSQLEYIYNPIAHDFADLFQMPTSLYSGKLFLFPQIVGGGKTLGGFVVGFAINHARNLLGAGVPRVRNVLYLTKDTSLRDQIAQELRDEPTKYGLVDRAPEVLTVTKPSDELRDFGALNRYDIVVSCVQPFWAGENPMFSPEERNSILARYQAILLDESHFANEVQVAKIVQDASRSLCFGLTASPLDATGAMFGRSVRVSVFGYGEASRHDDSMKGLGRSSYSDYVCSNMQLALYKGKDTDLRRGRNQVRDELRGQYRDIIQIVRDSEYQDHDQRWLEIDGNQGDLGLNPAVAVANRVVTEMLDLDKDMVNRTDDSIAPHRLTRRDQPVVGDPYYTHAIIRVESIEAAELIKDKLNSAFENNRAQFPRDHGWMATTAHGGNDQFQGMALNDDHPWMRYKCSDKASRTGEHEIDSQCSRILIVKDLAKEGINNKFALFTGLGCRLGSISSAIQILGRPIRSTHTVRDDGVHVVPPRSFDEIKVICHEAYLDNDNDYIIPWSLQFMEHMVTHTSDIEPIEQFIEQFDFEVEDVEARDDRRYPITYLERLQIAERVGASIYKHDGQFPSASRRAIINRMSSEPGLKRDAVEDWMNLVVAACGGHGPSVGKVRRQLSISGRMAQLDVALDTRVDLSAVPFETKARSHQRWHGGKDYSERMDSSVFAELVNDHYRSVVGLAEGSSLIAARTLDDLLSDFATDASVSMSKLLVDEVGNSLSKKQTEEVFKSALNDGVNLALDTQDYARGHLNSNANIVNRFGESRTKQSLYGFAVYHLAATNALQGIVLACDIS